MTETTSQTVVITGASAGIGRAVARLFAERGASIGLIARGEAGLAGAAEEVTIAGGKAFPVAADVTSFDEVEAAATEVEAQFGPIDVWVNVAFTSVFAPFDEISPAEFRRVTEVSYLGFVYGTMAALGLMKRRDRGVIVQVGSALGARSIPLQSAYCGAKHAINGFTSSLRCELLHDKSNVKVTVVQMPAVNTPQFSWVRSRLPRQPQPVSPIYQPEVAARAVLFAADHPDCREYWVGASTAATILANRLVPRLLDRYLARTGYSSQQTDQQVQPGRPDNLLAPVDGPPGSDHGAHGQFDERAHGRSLQQWVSQHIRLPANRKGEAPSPRERELARLLGARHLLQAAASAWAGQGAAFPGAVVDGLHAASMLAVATAEPRLRRACLADAALESLLASTGIALAASAIRSCPAAGT